MAIYLKKFETQSAYEAAQSGLILPNVSLTVDNNVVHYNPSSPVPPTPTHDYVEIGGVKWATMNIGANSITDTGLYFQWGDTQGYTADQVGCEEGKKCFGWNDYKYGEIYAFTKYNSTDGKTVLETSDDAVTSAWGGNWRMPTIAEFQALGTATTSAWTADYEGSGVAGLVLTANGDSSKKLFFPAADSCFEGDGPSVNSSGSYLSSNLDNDDDTKQNCLTLSFDNEDINYNSNPCRCFGMTVRGILDE